MSATETASVPRTRAHSDRSYLRAIGSAAWNDNKALLLITAAFVLSGFLAQVIIGIHGLMRDVFRESFGLMLVVLLLPLPLLLLVGRLQVKDESGRWLPGAKGWRIAWQRFGDRFANPRSIARALTAAVAITMMLNTFGSWKRVIPLVAPFSWDSRLASFDRALHFGVDPWRLLQPWLGYPRLTLWLDNLYFTWLPFVFSLMTWMVWTHKSALRQRALMGLVFVWIGLGTIGATVFSSAGPCYYDHLVTGPNPFVPLLSYLDGVAVQFRLFTPAMQQVAWTLNQTGKADIYSGISAMPSVHVAMPVLYALIGWELKRWLGVLLGCYALLTLIATVHLGWHYAVDGYASIIAVLLFWRLSARFIRPAPPIADSTA